MFTAWGSQLPCAKFSAKVLLFFDIRKIFAEKIVYVTANPSFVLAAITANILALKRKKRHNC